MLYSSFHKKRVFLICLVIGCLSFKSQAQESKPVFEEFWFQYYNKMVFSEKWSLSTDVGYRLKDGRFVAKSQYFIRSGMGYNITPSVRVLLGFANFGTHLKGDVGAMEYRPHQQLTTKHKFGKVGFGNRLRIEQRFIDVIEEEGQASLNTFNFRFRYRFLFDIPLMSLSKSDADKKLSLIIGDEVLFSAGKDNFLDFSAQNRFLVGPAVKLNKDITVLALYNFTSVTKSIPDISDEFGIFWLGLKHKLDLRD